MYTTYDIIQYHVLQYNIGLASSRRRACNNNHNNDNNNNSNYIIYTYIYIYSSIQKWCIPGHRFARPGIHHFCEGLFSSHL